MMGRRSHERLRQERETFDQLKVHDAIWFKLKLATGTIAILAFIVVLFVASRVLLNPSAYSAATLATAAIAMIADIAGLVGLVFGLVFRDGSGHLRPITGEEEK